MPTAFTTKELQLITEIVRTWPITQKLTWDLICKSCQLPLGFIPTRQSLCQKQIIVNAYKVRKTEIAKKKSEIAARVLPKSLQAAAEQIENLQEENKQLKKELAAMAEAAQTFIHNATRYMTHEQLTKKPTRADRKKN